MIRQKTNFKIELCRLWKRQRTLSTLIIHNNTGGSNYGKEKFIKAKY